MNVAVSLLDLYPTLLALAGSPIASTQGLSLLEGPGARAGVFSETTRQRNHKAFTRRDGTKLILSYQAPRHEVIDERSEQGVVGLFNSRSDYLEQESLTDAALLGKMRSAFYALYRDSAQRRSTTDPKQAELTDETVRELETLGYVEGESAR